MPWCPGAHRALARAGEEGLILQVEPAAVERCEAQRMRAAGIANCWEMGCGAGEERSPETRLARLGWMHWMHWAKEGAGLTQFGGGGDSDLSKHTSAAATLLPLSPLLSLFFSCVSWCLLFSLSLAPFRQDSDRAMRCSKAARGASSRSEPLGFRRRSSQTRRYA